MKKELIERSYQSVVNRGLISKNTKFEEFIDKFYEEVGELAIETPLGEGFESELADILLVAYNIAHHYKIDIEKALIEGIEKNERRAK